MELKILYEDDNLLTIDKPSGITVFPEGEKPSFAKATEGEGEKTLVDHLLERFPNLKDVGKPPRYGIVHRLDKDTSGILLVAKYDRTLEFLQKQFKERKVLKKYFALVIGNVKTTQGKIETLLGRAPKQSKKQKVYLPLAPETKEKKLRKAITEYKVSERFKNYTLIEAIPKTGRKHQIRVHFRHLGHPIAGDKIYGFKNQPKPEGLNRLFLHSFYLKIKLPDGKEREFKSGLPKDLKEVLKNLE